jgi:hypothetical protein
MKNISILFNSSLLILASTFLVACESGTMEKAGETADEAITDVGNKTEDLCEQVKEGVKAEDTDC